MSDIVERLDEAQRKSDALGLSVVTIFKDAKAEIEHLRAQVTRLTKVIDDRVADYADLEKNSRGGLTDLGKHAQRVVIGIREQFARILAVFIYGGKISMTAPKLKPCPVCRADDDLAIYTYENGWRHVECEKYKTNKHGRRYATEIWARAVQDAAGNVQKRVQKRSRCEADLSKSINRSTQQRVHVWRMSLRMIGRKADECPRPFQRDRRLLPRT
jgi:Zn ribbon nucleic-acid-binding protein